MGTPATQAAAGAAKEGGRMTVPKLELGLPLTPTQLRVLRMMVAGLRNTQIADAIGCGQRTIEHHRSRLLARTGCKTMCELGYWAAKQGIAPDPGAL